MNNAILQNAAVSSFVAAAIAGSFPVATSTSVYSGLESAALAFGEKVDSLVPNDATISQGSGIAAIPTTSAIQQAQLGKEGAMRACVGAAVAGRFSQDGTESDWTALAQAVVTLYDAAIAGLV
jgi:hypothetical protein